MNRKIVNIKNIFLRHKVYIALLIMSAVLIFMISARHISILTNIMAWDEIGYWGNAAYIAGYDWSSVVSAFAGYYSYGYSLILAFLLRVCGNSHIAYQMAIAVNAFLVTGSFFIANYIGIKYFKWKNKYYVLLASIIVTVYVNNITQSNYAWTEGLLIFLYWCLAALFLSLNQRYHFMKIVLIIAITVYIYCVHNRSLGIVIASFITIVLYIAIKKVSVKKVICFAIGTLLLILFEGLLKEHIKSAVYIAKSDVELVNTFAAASPWIIGKLLSLSGIIDLIKTFMNRFLYFGITTFGTFWLVCYWGIKKLREGIAEKKYNFFLIFLFLSVLGTFGLISVQLSPSSSYQSLLYGRYQDVVAGPVFLMGLLILIFDGKNRLNRCFLFFPLIMSILIQVAKGIPIYSDYFVPNCNVSLYKFWIGTENGGYEFNAIFLITALGMTVLYIVSFISYKNKVLGGVLLGCFVTCYMGIQVRDSEKVFEETFLNYQNMSKELNEIHEICKDANEIYYYTDENLSINTPLAMWLQFEMYDHKIVVVDSMENVKENSYIAIPRKKMSDTVFEATVEVEGILVSEDKFIALYVIS